MAAGIRRCPEALMSTVDVGLSRPDGYRRLPFTTEQAAAGQRRVRFRAAPLDISR